MYLLLLVLALGKQIVGQTNLDHLKIAAVIEHSKYHDGLIDLKEYICHRINMRVTFEMYNVSSMDPVFLDGLVHDVVREDIDLIIWLVSCNMLDFLPNKVSSEAVMLFLTEEKCSAKDPVGRKGGGSSQKFKGLADAMHHLKWPDVKIFYDESINGTEVLMLTNELSSRYVKSALFRINSSSSFTEKIRRTFISINQKAFSENRYLIILKKETLEVIIKEAASLWMLVSRNYWILISDDLDVKSLVQYGLNPRNANLIIFKDACDICREDLKSIEEATNEIQLTGQLPEETIKKHILTIVCLMVKLSENPESLKSISNCSNFTKFLANITGFAVPKNYSTLNHSCYTAYEMKTVTEGPLLTSTVARWRPDSRLFVMREFYPNAKYRLGNITLNVSTLTLLPYAVKKEDHGKIYFEGFCVMILKELSRQMNFSYKWVVPEDREFGMMVNGSFTGLVGLLERRETDMVIGPLTLTQERSQVIDYTYPYAEEGRGMLIRRPGNSSTSDLFKVFYVFDHASWLCCLSVIFFISTFLTVIDGLHKMSDSHNSIKGLPDSGTVKTVCLFSKLNWSEILWAIFTIYVSQNGAWEPKHIRSRIIVLSWWIFTIFITTYFTANLTAYFTVTIQISSIENLKDLADDKDILPFTLAGSVLYTEFKVD
ncbi:glutamate receptor ionotropic, delta-1 [Octopus bimaculoides]|nr:glutamate receptor ionotropic, delta-1 [Octopus bimaculoides]|eukprot:XP_014773477.1 PREDICTED: glutamate receptor ionotropic, delta-1-like [Octopus bimaculoides]